MYAVGEDSQLSQPVTVDLSNLFPQLMIMKLTEMTLTANRDLSDLHRLHWNTETAADETFDAVPLEDYQVTLNPMEIHTYMVQYMPMPEA